MKKSARDRIIVWSIISVLLIGVLVTGIHATMRFSESVSNFFDIEISSKNLDSYNSGNSNFAPNAVKSIEINWINGEVKIIESDVKEISICETATGNIEENQKMRYHLDNDGKLEIYSGKMNVKFFNLFENNMKSKTLTVTIPKKINDGMADSDFKLEDLKISTASSPVVIENINSEDIEVETASGNVTLTNTNSKDSDINTVSGTIDLDMITSETIETESVSGKVNVSGNYKDLNSSTISGKIQAELGKATTNTVVDSLFALAGKVPQEKLNLDSVSGKIEIIAPENIVGFTVNHDSVSGSFNCDFANLSNGEAVVDKEDKFTYGNVSDDATEINASTVSGEIKITALK